MIRIFKSVRFNNNYCRSYFRFNNRQMTANEMKIMKKRLRRLYLKIHPDFFNEFPDIQKQNTQTLANLNDFVENLKDGAIKSKGYPLKFAVRQNDGDNLKNVSTILRISRYSDLPFMTQVERELQRLYELCDLRVEYHQSKEQDLISDSDSSYLIDFLMDIQNSAVNSMDQKEARRRIRLEIDYRKSVMGFLGWRIMFGENIPLDTQIGLLKKFHRIITKMKDDETPMKNKSFHRIIVFNESTEHSFVDLRGRIILALFEDVKLWLNLVNNPATWKQAEALYINWQKILAKERETADHLGIAHMFCDDFLLSYHEDYLEFLNRLRFYKDDLTKTSLDLSDLILRVQPEHQYPKFHVDAETGVLTIPINCTASLLSTILSSNGFHAIEIGKRHSLELDELEQIELNVKRRFNLAKLKSSDDISRNQMMESCKRLINFPRDLDSLLYGVDLEISNQFALENGWVKIKWDFVL